MKTFFIFPLDCFLGFADTVAQVRGVMPGIGRVNFPSRGR